jgi:uncharacterized protein YeaO (DUF488 family)
MALNSGSHGMGSIAIKRVYDPPSPDDGFRVLVDRLWPRGMTKDAAALDLWAKDLAPSPDLRKEFNHQPERFAEFTHHYLGELSRNPAVVAFRSELKRPKVTLLYGAHDRANNHAIVLADFLRGGKNGAAKKPAAKRPATKKPPTKKLSAKPVKKPAKKKAKPQTRTQAATRSRSR